MAYTPPAGDAANVSWVGAPAYTPPAGNAANATWQTGGGSSPDPVTGTGAIVLPIVVSGVGSHAVAGAGAAVFPLTVSGAGEHGVAGAGAVALGISVAGAGAHGVAGAGVVTVPSTVAGTAVHQRYELRGEVRLGGVLVNRRVRAYSRDTGVLLGEADTVVGKFRVHVGFAEIECYATPIDLSPGATDWLPPTANRILAVLASDTA
jgi:hypothetical protein